MKLSPGRPLEFDPDAVLDAAMHIFWRNGFENTSMQDLLEAMRISKSSLYQAFGGKQTLFERCLARYGDLMMGQLQDALASAPSGWDFIRHFLESVLDEACGVTEARGCLVLNTANEFARRDPVIAEAVAQGLGRFHGVMLAAVQRAQFEGAIPPERDAPMLANYLVVSMSGLKTLSKAGADEASLKGTIELVLKALT